MSSERHITKTLIAIATIAMTSGSAYALDGGDAAKGEGVFKKCMSCHMVGPEAKNKVGPVLNDLFGRAAGAAEGYKYGKSIVEAGEAGLVWTEDEIFDYLADPKKYLRAKLENKKAKSKMSFKLKKEDQRKDVIAYLMTFSPDAAAAEEESEAATEETTTD